MRWGCASYVGEVAQGEAQAFFEVGGGVGGEGGEGGAGFAGAEAEAGEHFGELGVEGEDTWGQGGVGGDAFEVDFAAQFEDEAFGGFFPDAGDACEARGVAAGDGGAQFVGGGGGEDAEGDFGADAADGEQEFKEGALFDAGEAVEGEEVFADVQVGVEVDFGADFADCAEDGARGEDLEADAAGFDDEVVGASGEECATNGCDHRCVRCVRRLVWGAVQRRGDYSMDMDVDGGDVGWYDGSVLTDRSVTC